MSCIDLDITSEANHRCKKFWSNRKVNNDQNYNNKKTTKKNGDGDDSALLRLYFAGDNLGE